MATFLGGEKLQAYLKDLAAKVRNPGTLEVGFLEGATYPDGTSVAMVAAVQEFGSRDIPPRPFFRNMIRKESGHWGTDVGQVLKANDMDATRALELMGEEIKGELRESIIETNEPPNAPATIKAKGASKPLVDTGHMLNSIGDRVTK
ncbi:MAG TPA: hypothetical protein VG248_03440 [Caulobacteraceae bacterium]|nr:hypothetical protein [Caulobacteraceae bacterium]